MKTSIKLLAACLRRAFGTDGAEPLGAGPLEMPFLENGKGAAAADFVHAFFCALGDGETGKARKLCASWSKSAERTFSRALDSFTDMYEGLEDRYAEELLDRSHSDEEAAWHIARTWAPEIATPEEDAVACWRLTQARPNPVPLEPQDVVLQLNGLYTLPDRFPHDLPAELLAHGRSVMEDPGRKLADYDHPVPLFEGDDAHELISFLEHLEDDIDFEKSIGVFASDYRVPILLSLSVTHSNLDDPISLWINHLLEIRSYRNFKLYLLTEGWCRRLDNELFGGVMHQFGVAGPYGRHFNALKYCALLFERLGLARAGFKLDTDEAIRSKDLFDATGKSWFQTLCHPWWGGTALDRDGREVYLGVNEGEYVNGADIERLGYREALRCPDVRPPQRAAGRDLFFQKGYAHGNATAWYNKFDRLEEFISHPVVKGGGYGITNEGLRRAVPFTWSRVGRAEDQQFYFCALARKVRGIFHPDLRIAHYKGSVSASEARTEATRLAGDMYRVIQFSWLARHLDVKKDIDPMPGVFAGPLADAQAFFHILHRCWDYLRAEKADHALLLLSEGLDTVDMFQSMIESGDAERELAQERMLWSRFIAAVDELEEAKLARLLDQALVRR